MIIGAKEICNLLFSIREFFEKKNAKRSVTETCEAKLRAKMIKFRTKKAGFYVVFGPKLGFFCSKLRFAPFSFAPLRDFYNFWAFLIKNPPVVPSYIVQLSLIFLFIHKFFIFIKKSNFLIFRKMEWRI